MNENLVNKCKKVIHKLQKDHPIASLFSEPVDTALYPDYKELIKRPTDFSTIKRNLRKGRYVNLSQFDDDVNLVFSNAIKYNGKASVYAKIAQQLRRIYIKLKSEYLADLKSLTDRCIKLQQDMDNLLISPPKTIATDLSSYFVDIKKAAQPKKKFEQSIPALQKKLAEYNSAEHCIRILFLIRELEPKLVKDKNDLTIDLEILKPETLLKLQEYVDTYPL